MASSSSSSLAATFGLAPNGPHQPPSYGTHYIIFHFVFAYVLISSRPWKIAYKIDHQVSPREDLAKYGPAAVQKGKLTQAQLDQIKRVEGCHANSVEHFAMFAASMLFAHVAGVETSVINRAGLVYTLARVLYVLAYTFITKITLAYARGIFWWASNVVCIRLLWSAGKAFNAKA